jgi:hypothetical protein
MGWDATPEPGAYIAQLARHARRLQREARAASERGDYTRASRLIGDAQLLAEDVHDMVSAAERREFAELVTLASYDTRPEAEPAPLAREIRRSLSSRAFKLALGASLTIGVALTEF